MDSYIHNTDGAGNPGRVICLEELFPVRPSRGTDSPRWITRLRVFRPGCIVFISPPFSPPFFISPRIGNMCFVQGIETRWKYEGRKKQYQVAKSCYVQDVATIHMFVLMLA